MPDRLDLLPKLCNQTGSKSSEMKIYVSRLTTTSWSKTSRKFLDNFSAKSQCWRKKDWLAQLGNERQWPENLNKSSMSLLKKTQNFQLKSKSIWKRSKSWTPSARNLWLRARLCSQLWRAVWRTRARPSVKEPKSSEASKLQSASKRTDFVTSCAKSKGQNVWARQPWIWKNWCVNAAKKSLSACRPRAGWKTSRHLLRWSKTSLAKVKTTNSLSKTNSKLPSMRQTRWLCKTVHWKRLHLKMKTSGSAS